MNLYDAISERICNIGVMGLGHIGITIASVFSNKGFSVLGCDVIQNKVDNIMSGNFKVAETELDDMLQNAVKSGKLLVTADTNDVAKTCDIIIICVQTPISKENIADLSFLQSACETVGHYLTTDKMVIIESSVPPRTTMNVSALLEKMSGLRCGKDFWLSNCPERLAPGNSVKDFINNDRIIGGIDEKSLQLAYHLFIQVIKGRVFLTDSLTAEIVKLSENTFRDVNIAFANELALICEQVKADVQEVIKLANTHPRVNIHMPGCGVGGPCIPKDPYLLISSKHSIDYSVIKCSRRINSFMESHTVDMIINALKYADKNIRNSRISILGVTYKKGINDIRDTPAKYIIKELLNRGAHVNVYDPLCNESFGGNYLGLYDAISNTDCVVILTDHNEFAYLDLLKIKNIMNDPACLVDGRRIIDPIKAVSIGIRYYGIGYGKESYNKYIL